MSPKTKRPSIGGRRAAAKAKRAAKAKAKGAPNSKRWARGVLEAPTVRIAGPPASAAAGASAQPSAIVRKGKNAVHRSVSLETKSLLRTVAADSKQIHCTCS